MCYTAVPWELVAMRKAGKVFKGGMRLFRCMEMGCLVKRKTLAPPKHESGPPSRLSYQSWEPYSNRLAWLAGWGLGVLTRLPGHLGKGYKKQGRSEYY